MEWCDLGSMNAANYELNLSNRTPYRFTVILCCLMLSSKCWCDVFNVGFICICSFFTSSCSFLAIDNTEIYDDIVVPPHVEYKSNQNVMSHTWQFVPFQVSTCWSDTF